MRKKKNTENIIDFKQCQTEKANKIDVYEALTDTIDYITYICSERSAILEEMQETAEEAITAAGLKFGNFKLSWESASFFYYQTIYSMFDGDVPSGPNNSETAQKEMAEMFEGTPYVLDWVYEGKNGTHYSAVVYTDEDPDADVTVELTKKKENQTWVYNFDDKVWEDAEKYRVEN